MKSKKVTRPGDVNRNSKFACPNNKIDKKSEIYIQIEECEKIRIDKPVKNKPKTIHQTHPQAIYTSRLLNFKNLSEPENSSDLSHFQNNTGNIII